ncbi:MAG: beta strand repeat-containing protein, partial [Planctomycetaceae bacterium]
MFTKLNYRRWAIRTLENLKSRSIRRKRRKGSPGVEALEDRALLTTFTVTNTADSGAGSLRQAVLDANASAGADIIEFDESAVFSFGTITLTSGEIPVTDEVEINGLGTSFSISGNNASQIFNITGDGGASTIRDLTLKDATSAIRLNNGNGRLDIERVTFDSNSTTGVGGGIVVDSSDYQVRESTFLTNSATIAGGAIYAAGNTTGWIVNSTFSGNSNTLYNVTGDTQLSEMHLRNVTLVDSSGYGISNEAFAGGVSDLSIANSIIANSTGANVQQAGAGSTTFTSLGHNISDDASAGFTETGDQTNTNPLLASLADNGGAVQTIALLPGSPAIDAGHSALARDGDFNALTTDGRGAGFARNVDGNEDTTRTVDIGAFEAPFLGDLIVSTDTDIVDGDYSDGELSLREAIVAANDRGGADEITFAEDLDSSIVLTLGELKVLDDLTITGPGPGDLVMQTFANTRLIHATNAVNNLTLENLTLTGGNAVEAGFGGLGGGVYFESLSGSTLAVNNAVIRGNSADTGGGIFTRHSDVIVTNSTFSGNAARDDSGGAIEASFGAVTVTNSTISGNTAAFDGGAIKSGGAVSVTNSTVSGNSSGFDGGGIDAFGDVTVTNSTISGNTSSFNGGGVYTYLGRVTLTNSTISGNTASRVGGGIGFKANNNGEALTVHNTIIAGNSDDGTAPDFLAPGGGSANLDVKSSIIGDTTGTGLVAGNNNQLDVDWTTVLENDGTDPILADNGGPVQTIALLADSPAIDAGDNALAVDSDDNPLTTDGRGAGFARTVDGDTDATRTVDIGAFEGPFLGDLIVSTAADIADGDYSEGELSLREAIVAANDRAGADEITFALGVSGSTIGLTLGELSVSDDLTITGPGAAGDLVIDAQGNSRVIHGTATAANLTLQNLTVTGGNGESGIFNGWGGGVFAYNTLTVTNSTISGNTANFLGGGIASDFGSVTLANSTVSGNTTEDSGAGGGIYGPSSLTLMNSTVSGNTSGTGGGFRTFSAYVTLSNSTISGNTSQDHGGGIYARDSVLNVTNSTISGNSTSGVGGGIRFNSSGGETLTIHNSIIAGNSDDGTAP